MHEDCGRSHPNADGKRIKHFLKGNSSQIVPEKTKADLSQNIESCDKTISINVNLNVNEVNKLSNKKKAYR